MNDHLFSQQHGRLLDTQGGLGTVWRRAAQNRLEDRPADDVMADGIGPWRWLLAAVGVVAAAGYLMSVWLDDRVDEPADTGAIVGAPLAPSPASATAPADRPA